MTLMSATFTANGGVTQDGAGDWHLPSTNSWNNTLFSTPGEDVTGKRARLEVAAVDTRSGAQFNMEVRESGLSPYAGFRIVPSVDQVTVNMTGMTQVVLDYDPAVKHYEIEVLGDDTVVWRTSVDGGTWTERHRAAAGFNTTDCYLRLFSYCPTASTTAEAVVRNVNTQPNDSPVADAGDDRSVDSGAVVELAWSAPDVAVASATWRQTSGPEVVLFPNLVSNPVPDPSKGGWRISGSESFQFVTDEGLPAIEGIDPSTTVSGGLYIDPTDNFTVKPGDVLRFSVEVKALTELAAASMRLQIFTYAGAKVSALSGTIAVQPVEIDTWTRIEASATVAADSAEGGYLRTLVWPSWGTGQPFVTGAQFRARRIIVQINTDVPYTDGSYPVFKAPAATYGTPAVCTFGLTVTDDQGETSPEDTVTITAEAGHRLLARWIGLDQVVRRYTLRELIGTFTYRNEVTNPEVRYNTAGWWASGQTFEHVPQGDGWAAQLTAPFSVSAPPPVAVTPGQFWALRITFNGPAGRQIRFNTSTTGGQSGLTPVTYLTLTGEPQEVVIPGTPQITAAGQLYLYVYPATGWVDGDKFTVTRYLAARVAGPGVAPPAYFSGDTIDTGDRAYTWDGEAHTSPSVATYLGAAARHEWDNLFPDASFEGEDTEGWSAGSDATVARETGPSIDGVGRLAITVADGASIFSSRFGKWETLDPAAAGKWLAWGIGIRRADGPTHYRQVLTFSATVGGATIKQFLSSIAPISSEEFGDGFPRDAFAAQVPDGAAAVEYRVMFYNASNGNPEAGVVYADAMAAVLDTTQGAALDGAKMTVTPPGPDPDSLEAITGSILVSRVEPSPEAGLGAAYYEEVDLTDPLGPERTVLAVVTPAAGSTGNQSIIDGSPERAQLAFNGGDTWVAYAGTAPAQTASGYASDQGQTVAVGGRFAPSSVRLYRRDITDTTFGAPIAEGTPAVSTVTDQLRIGARAYNYEAFTGTIHALYVIPRVLTDSEFEAAGAWIAEHHMPVPEPVTAATAVQVVEVPLSAATAAPAPATLPAAATPGHLLTGHVALDKSGGGFNEIDGWTLGAVYDAPSTSQAIYYRPATGDGGDAFAPTWVTAKTGAIGVIEWRAKLAGTPTFTASPLVDTEQTELAVDAGTAGAGEFLIAASSVDSTGGQVPIWSAGYATDLHIPGTETGSGLTALAVAHRNVTAGESTATTFSLGGHSDQMSLIVGRVPAYAGEPAPAVPVPTTTLFVDQSDYPDGWTTWPTYVWLPPDSPNTYGDLGTKGTDITNLSDTGKYTIVAPEDFYGLDNKLGINGGHSYRIVGLQAEFTKCNFGPFLPGKDVETPDKQIVGNALLNQFLHINGRNIADNTDPTFRIVEGAYAKGEYFWEFITYDGKGDKGPDSTVLLQNVRADQLNWVLTETGGHEGSDVFQAWNGAGRNIIRGMTIGEATYQGFMLQMGNTGFGVNNVKLLELDRVDITGSRTHGNGILFYDQADHAGRTTKIGAKGTDRGVYLDPNPADAFKQDDQMAAAIYDQITWGPSPFGENVPAAHVGLNYTTSFSLRTTKPDAANTGLSVSGITEAELADAITEGSTTASNTPLTITSGGTETNPRVIRGVHFQRCIEIANGVSWVTFEDCVFERFGIPTGDECAIKQFGGSTTGIVVKNSTARLEESERHYLRAYAFQGRAITLDRVDVSGWGDGFGPSAIGGVRGYGKAYGCYFHDIPHFADDGYPGRAGSHPDGSHPDAIQAQYGLDLLEVIGCTLPGPYTAALLAKSNTSSPITKLVVENNWVVLEDTSGLGLNFLDMEAGGAQDWSVKWNEFDMTLNPSRAAIAASPAFIAAAAWEGNKHKDGTDVRVWNGTQLVTV